MGSPQHWHSTWLQRRSGWAARNTDIPPGYKDLDGQPATLTFHLATKGIWMSSLQHWHFMSTWLQRSGSAARNTDIPLGYKGDLAFLKLATLTFHVHLATKGIWLGSLQQWHSTWLQRLSGCAAWNTDILHPPGYRGALAGQLATDSKQGQLTANKLTFTPSVSGPTGNTVKMTSLLRPPPPNSPLNLSLDFRWQLCWLLIICNTKPPCMGIVSSKNV